MILQRNQIKKLKKLNVKYLMFDDLFLLILYFAGIFCQELNLYGTSLQMS